MKKVFVLVLLLASFCAYSQTYNALDYALDSAAQRKVLIEKIEQKIKSRHFKKESFMTQGEIRRKYHIAILVRIENSQIEMVNEKVVAWVDKKTYEMMQENPDKKFFITQTKKIRFWVASFNLARIYQSGHGIVIRASLFKGPKTAV